MPYTIQKRSSPGKKPRWAVVDKSSGQVKGYSSTKKDAKKSADARNASHHGWKPSGKKK